VAHASSLPPLSAGRTLGERFEIVGVLGEGGMGIVYDARRIAEGDRVALKVIHQHLAGDAQIRGRFTREAAILRRLEGEHLCPVLDFGEVPDPRRADAGLLYMALPRIDGQALDMLLKKSGHLPLVRVVTIMLDVCEALREAHSQGVIHRDLKPGNVLVREGDRAVVVDFPRS
jgi:serine/threonine protein kinase